MGGCQELNYLALLRKAAKAAFELRSSTISTVWRQRQRNGILPLAQVEPKGWYV